MDIFNRIDLMFFLPNSFKGLSKGYILEKIFDEKIQASWKPQMGDIIVTCTGNIFVISSSHSLYEKLGGTVYFFGGGLCSKDDSCILNGTKSYVLNKDGMEYYYDDNAVIQKRTNFNYSKISDMRYVPYPHELI